MVKIRQMAPLYETKLLNLEWIDIQYTLVLSCAINHVNIFGSFLDIRQNAEWSRFFGPPGTRVGLQFR